MNSSPLLSLIILACILSSAALATSALPENKATRWFQQEFPSLISSNIGDTTAPKIYGVNVAPSVLKCGDPRSEINAFIYDPAGIEMA